MERKKMKEKGKNEWKGKKNPSTGKLTSISYVTCMEKFISFLALGH